MSDSPKLYVVHVVGSLDDATGGLQSAVLSIASSNARAGHRVAIVSTQEPTDGHAGLSQLDPRVETHIFNRSKIAGRLGRSKDLSQWMQANLETADVVHTHGIWNVPVYFSAVRAVIRRKRLVMSPHGSLDPFDLAKHSWAKKILGRLAIRPLLARADTILCTTDREVAILETYGATCHTSVAVLPPGPAPLATTTASGTRSRLGLAPASLMLLFLGRIDYKKGLPPLLHALTLMSADTQLVIAGTGTPEYEKLVLDLVDELRIADRVHFAGWVSGDDKSNLLAAADAFVLLSDRENYGIAVIEAVQAGTPVIITSEVFISEELERAGAALVTTQDPRRAAADIDRLLHDDGQLDAMRKATRQFVRDELSEARIDARYESALTVQVS